MRDTGVGRRRKKITTSEGIGATPVGRESRRRGRALNVPQCGLLPEPGR